MMILMLTFLFACADSDPTAESSPEPVECEGLDEQACEEAEGCSPIEGWRVHGEYDCEDWGPKEYAGCYTMTTNIEEFVCSDVITYFHPPGAPDECWEFGHACTPDGWIECDRNCWESE